MFKLLKNKIVMTFVVTTVVGGISTNNFPILRNIYTTIRTSQVSTIVDKTENSQNVQENNTDKVLNSLKEEKNINNIDKNKSNTKKKKTTSSESKKITNNKVETKKEQTSANIEKANNSILSNKNTSTQSKEENSNKITEVEIPTIHYDRTTSIYANDTITLLRVEYYKNNKLTYYSVVEKFDATTKSYTERIYKCNRETNIDPLIRTDVYVNGKLTKSF